MRGTTAGWVLAAVLVAGACARRQEAPELPTIATEKFAPAVREAITKALEAARAKPADAAAIGKLGMVLHAHEQYATAAACYRRAQAMEPKVLRWPYYLAQVEAQQGNGGAAEVALRRAVDIDRKFAPAQLRLAELALEGGRLEEARGLYDKLLQEDGTSAAAHYGMGRVRATEGHAAGAADWLRKACVLFPTYGAAHFALAQNYRKLGAPDKAKEHLALYEKYKLVAPPSGDTLLAEVRALSVSTTEYLRQSADLEAAGRLEEALALHQKALEADPHMEQAHVNLISLYGRLGKPAEAEKHYHEAVKLKPNLADAHYNYGVLLFGQKKFREAKAAFTRAVEVNPRYAEALHNLGYSLEQEGKLDQAAARYREAIANQPQHRLAHFHLGRILVSRRQYAEAIAHFEKTVTPQDESTPGFLYALGAAYARSGDRTRAVEWLEKARGMAREYKQEGLVASIERDLGVLRL
jgi:superkiller protein 3